MSLIVVEQQLPRPTTPDALASALDRHAWCRGLYGIRHVHSLIARHDPRMICVFDAPDAEVVRALARRMGFPFERAWAAELVTTG